MSTALPIPLPVTVHTPTGPKPGRFMGYSNVTVAYRQHVFLPRPEPAAPIDDLARVELEAQGYAVLTFESPVLMLDDGTVYYGYDTHYEVRPNDLQLDDHA